MRHSQPPERRWDAGGYLHSAPANAKTLAVDAALSDHYRRRASVYRISPPSGAHAALKVNRRVSPSTRYVYVYEVSDMEFGRLATRGRTVSVVPDTS